MSNDIDIDIDLEAVDDPPNEPNSPTISKEEWHDFLKRQQDRENAKHLKRLAKIEAEREKLVKMKERTKKEREKARLRAARAAEQAVAKTTKKNVDEGNHEEEEVRQRKILRIYLKLSHVKLFYF